MVDFGDAGDAWEEMNELDALIADARRGTSGLADRGTAEALEMHPGHGAVDVSGFTRTSDGIRRAV